MMPGCRRGVFGAMTRVKRVLGLVVSWLVVVAGLAGMTALTAEAHPVGTFVPIQPVRVLDTRNALGVATTSAIPAGGTVNVKIAGANGLPSGISAIVANVTVVAPQGAGHVTAWPGGSAMPTASNLNYVAGQTVPNQIVVGVGADGSVICSFMRRGTCCWMSPATSRRERRRI